MNITKKALALVGVALLGSGAFAGNATITLDRVQQRYPWNGMVDIDYTVTNVENPADYYVKFTADAKVDGEDKTYILHDFLDAHTLVDASNGTWRVTWTTGTDNAKFFATNVSFKAELVFAPGDKSQMPYPFYTVIDVSEGKDAASYPVTYEYFASLAEATNKYSQQEYKTDKIVLRRIHKTTFTMGAPTTQPGYRCDNSGYYNPETLHEVTLTQDYDIGIYEITQKQWANVMGALPTGAQSATGDDIACAFISYQLARGTVDGCNVALLPQGKVDSTSFIGILRAKTGLETLDLPTEAQWENACRAGTTTSTYFGDVALSDSATLGMYCWYTANSRSRMHGVGQKLPNDWGLYDMLGNAFEWCRDRVTPSPNDDWGSESVTDPLRAVNGNVTPRGGCWGVESNRVRCAARRGADSVSIASNHNGLRLSRTLP